MHNKRCLCGCGVLRLFIATINKRKKKSQFVNVLCYFMAKMTNADILNVLESQDSNRNEFRSLLPAVYKTKQESNGDEVITFQDGILMPNESDNNSIVVPSTDVPSDWYNVKDTSGRHLGRVLGRYAILQPRIVFDLLSEALDTHLDDGFDAKKLNFLQYDGGKVYQLTYPLGKFNVGDGDDPVDVKFFFESSHDGSKKSTAGAFHERLICTNGLRVIEGQRLFAKHTENSVLQVYEFIYALENVLGHQKRIADVFNWASTQRVSDLMIERFAKTVLGVKPNAIVSRSSEDVSNRTVAKFELLQEDIATELATSDSVWGLFNGATRYATHTATRRKGSTVQSFLSFDSGKTLNDRALRWLTEYATANVN